MWFDAKTSEFAPPTDHTALSNIGDNTHDEIDQQLNSLGAIGVNAVSHMSSASMTHGELELMITTLQEEDTEILGAINTHTFGATKTHPQLDTAASNSASHIADATIHYAQTAIDHANLLNKGSNTHAQIDTAVAGLATHVGALRYTHANIDTMLDTFDALAAGWSNTHPQIDSYISAFNTRFNELPSFLKTNTVYYTSNPTDGVGHYISDSYAAARGLFAGTWTTSAGVPVKGTALVDLCKDGSGLACSGTVYGLTAVMCGYVTGTATYTLQVNGTQGSTGGPTFAAISDARTKSDVADYAGASTAGERLAALRVKSWVRETDGASAVGVVAQDLVGGSYADCVSKFGSVTLKCGTVVDDCLAVSYDRIHTDVLCATQNHHAALRDLTAEVQRLTARVRALEDAQAIKL